MVASWLTVRRGQSRRRTCRWGDRGGGGTATPPLTDSWGSAMLATVARTVAEQLGVALRTVREAVGVTQGELGRRIDKKQTYISEWESGRKTLPLRLMPDVEAALGVSRGTLLAHAGFVDHDVTVRDLLASDPTLAPVDRQLLLGMYERSRLRMVGLESEGDGVAGHPERRF